MGRYHAVASDKYNSLHFSEKLSHTVDLVIFACLNFREFGILGFFFSSLNFDDSRAIIIIIFARFLTSQISPPRKIRGN